MVFHLLWAILAAGVGIATASFFWSTYRDEIRHWLMEKNLQRSTLAEAFVLLDTVTASVRAVLRVRTSTAQHAVTVNEKELSAADVAKLARDDPRIYELLREHGSVKVNLLTD